MASCRITGLKDKIPVALTIAGSDCSGGAGIQADCRTFERLGIFPTTAVTAIVAQSPGNVREFEIVSPQIFRVQLEEIGKTFPLAAAKTGMLGNGDILRATADFFRENREIPLVVDPVVKASAGVDLIDDESLELAKDELFPRATLVTPNRMEAESILGNSIRSRADFEKAAESINSRFGCAVLLKGGHFEPEKGEVMDVLCVEGESGIFRSPRLAVPDLHGTGCVLSAAIAAGLAKKMPLVEAVREARKNLRKWMENHHGWSLPRETHAISIER